VIQGPNAVQDVEYGLVPNHRHGNNCRNKRPAHVGGGGGMAAIDVVDETVGMVLESQGDPGSLMVFQGW
jgi:hypothetical protein